MKFELDKMATLMGVAGQRTYAAGASLAQQQQNITAIRGQQSQMWANVAPSIGKMNLGKLTKTGYTPSGFILFCNGLAYKYL